MKINLTIKERDYLLEHLKGVRDNVAKFFNNSEPVRKQTREIKNDIRILGSLIKKLAIGEGR